VVSCDGIEAKLADILGTNFVEICFCWFDVGIEGIEIVLETFCS